MSSKHSSKHKKPKLPASPNSNKTMSKPSSPSREMSKALDSTTTGAPAPAPAHAHAHSSIRKRNAEDTVDKDAITILNAVIDFKSKNHGSHPTPSTMAPFHDSLKNRLRKPLSLEQLHTKFRSLKKRYYQAVDSGVGPSADEKSFFDLSVKAWGEKVPNDTKLVENKNEKQIIEADKDGMESDDHRFAAAVAEADKSSSDDDNLSEDEDADDDDEGYEAICSEFKCLTSKLKKHWENEGLSMAVLKLGLKNMDRSKAAALEKMWREHEIAEMEVNAKVLDVKSQVLKKLEAVLC